MACGGASTGSVSGINQFAALSDAFDDAFPTGKLTTTDEAVLPATGVASFTGYMTIAPSRLTPFLLDNYRVTAQTTLGIDFASGDVTGETGQFYDATDVLTPEYGSPRDGSVTYELAAITSGTNFYTGFVNGSVETSPGRMTNVSEAVIGSVMGRTGDGFRVATFSDVSLDVQVYALED